MIAAPMIAASMRATITIVVGAIVRMSAPIAAKIAGLDGIVAPRAPVSVVPIAAIVIHRAAFEIRRFIRRDVSVRWIVLVLSLGRRRGRET